MHRAVRVGPIVVTSTLNRAEPFRGLFGGGTSRAVDVRALQCRSAARVRRSG